jgi:hypothetical protein
MQPQGEEDTPRCLPKALATDIIAAMKFNYTRHLWKSRGCTIKRNLWLSKIDRVIKWTT